MTVLTSETSTQNSPSRLTTSVVIPVRDGGLGFRRCLQGITEAAPASTEIIVVADGDTDGSWHVAEEFGVKVLRNDRPQGPPRSRNFGAQAAQGDILFFLDADVAIRL
jgi:glycosyltransferase involved in cell wall biosynthesis